MRKKNELIIADSGAIFSLALLDQLELLIKLFEEIKIPIAVWEEITLQKNTPYYQKIYRFFEHKVYPIKSSTELVFGIDYGESESIILYKELNANVLLIDDRKARKFAENIGVNCVGTLGILIRAKEKKLIPSLQLLFRKLFSNRRYYSLRLLNAILIQSQEEEIA